MAGGFTIAGVGKTGDHPRICLIRDRKIPDDPTDKKRHVGLVLACDDKQDRVIDLTAISGGAFSRLTHIYEQRKPIDLIQALIATQSSKGLADNTHSLSAVRYAAPIDPGSDTEVWCAGVTIEDSKRARRLEMGAQVDELSVYDKVYSLDVPPELFFKGNARRVVGPGEPIRLSPRTEWMVPEPELAVIINSRKKFTGGITIFDDVSCRDVEGKNPLYLPKAKIFTGSSAMGPTVSLNHEHTDEDLKSLEISMEILRDGKNVFEGKVSFSKMIRKIEDLAHWLTHDDTFPDGVILSTGTGVIPPDGFTLQVGDIVRITIPGIGTLENPVEGPLKAA